MKRLFFLLLPLFLLADIQFASSASFDDNKKRFAALCADAIESELNITLIKNFESSIYDDEAALYALKNRIIKFTIVRKDLFDELGLEYSKMQNYGFEPLVENNGVVLLTESRFFSSFSQAQRAKLLARLKKLKD